MNRIISEDLLNAVIDDLSQLSEGGGLDELLVQLRCLPLQPSSGQVGVVVIRDLESADKLLRFDNGRPEWLNVSEALALIEASLKSLRTQPQAPKGNES